VGREEFLQEWDTERARYDEILSATRALRGAVANEAAAGRQAVQSKRDQGDLITRMLLFFGPFLPLLVLLFLGWRYRSLMRETDAFRRAATRARREADALLAATGDGVVGIDVQGKCRFLNRAGAERLG
jgi:PAS domain-containing protein